MQVFCSNCNTPHDITYAQANRSDTSVINCRKCDKKIKFQFCPHCGAFYSVTFSNIKHGRYKYSCKRCNKDFAIEFTPSEQTLPDRAAPAAPEKPPRPVTTTEEKISMTGIEKPVLFINNSINSFSTGELFKFTSEAFTIKKILIACAGIAGMFAIIQPLGVIENLFIKKSLVPSTQFTGSVINLFPMAVIFSFYTLFSSIISKISLDRIFYSKIK